MPVDLSKIGLTGLESYQSRMESAAQSRYLAANAGKIEQETEGLERQQALADKASARLNEISMGKRQSAVDPEKAASEMTSNAEVLETLADVYARGGAPETAMDFFKAAGDIRKQESDIDNDAVLAQQRKLENVIKGADVVSRYLGKAQNQSEWEYGIDQLRKQGIVEPELIDQMAAIPYDPDVAAYFNEQAIAAVDRARLDMTARTEARLTKQGALDAAQAQQRIALQEARDAETRRHNLAIEKASGGKAGGAAAPNKDELTSVENALRASVYKGVTKGEEGQEFGSAAEYVASSAKALIAQDKALSWQTAVQRAIMQAQTSGAFSTTEGEGKFLGIFGSETPPEAKFKTDGLTPATAIPQPSSKAAMTAGKYYITARGRAKWTGSAFELAE